MYMAKNTKASVGSDHAHNNLPASDCAENLSNSNKARAFETKEKEKRVSELVVASHELAHLSQENTRMEAELTLTKKKLLFEKKAKRKQAEELAEINEDIKSAKASQKAHIEDLREMMYMTSHQLRTPVVQILGLADILDTTSNTPAEVNEIVGCMKESAETLDGVTKELTTFIHNREVKAKNKGSKK